MLYCNKLNVSKIIEECHAYIFAQIKSSKLLNIWDVTQNIQRTLECTFFYKQGKNKRECNILGCTFFTQKI